MRSFIFNGHDFGELTHAKVVSETPLSTTPKVVRLKVYLDPKMKATAEQLDALRRKMCAALYTNTPAGFQYQDNYQYRGAICTDASTWDDFLEAGSCELVFTINDPIAFGVERMSAGERLDINGTAPTWPTFELVAAEGDSVMVLHLGAQRFVNVVGTFEGGERVMVDCERESVTIDGVDADAQVGFYSDFFPLTPGENELAFAGCTEHTTSYRERWL